MFHGTYLYSLCTKVFACAGFCAVLPVAFVVAVVAGPGTACGGVGGCCTDSWCCPKVCIGCGVVGIEERTEGVSRSGNAEVVAGLELDRRCKCSIGGLVVVNEDKEREKGRCMCVSV